MSGTGIEDAGSEIAEREIKTFVAGTSRKQSIGMTSTMPRIVEMPFRRDAGENPARRAGLPRSPISDLRSRPSGFTLIEILVVVVILAALGAAVTIAIGGAGGGRQLARDGERLRALIAYACEQAELSGRQIGVSLDRDGYRFSRSEHADWLPERDGELRPRKWSAAPDVVLTRDDQRVAVGAEFPDKPQLVCFSSGELTAFRLDLALADASAHFRIDGDADGAVRAESVDVRAP